MKNSYHNRWIRLVADSEKWMERKQNNVLLSWLILLCWWAYIQHIIQIADPFSFLSTVSQQSATSGFLFFGGIAGSIVGLLFLKKNARRRTLGLLVLWIIVLIYLPAAIHPAPSLSSNDRQIAEFIGGVWKLHPNLLSGFFAFKSGLVLHFVFKNQRAKLKHWWGLFLVGLLALGVIYTISPVLGFLYAILFPQEFFIQWLKAPSERDVRLAGSKLLTTKEVQSKFRQQQNTESRAEASVEFGGVSIPISLIVNHLMVIGSSGSGKSITLRLLMQGCLPQVSPVTPCRAIVFDPKRSSYSDLLGMDIAAEIIILNPFDGRACSYDLAKDFKTPTHFEALAQLLIPDRKGGTDPIWFLAPRRLVVGVLELLAQNAPDRWRFSDLIRATDSLKLLTALLNSSPENQHYTEILGSEKTALNIYSSLRSEIDKFRSTAALWDNCATSVSIRQWLAGGQIWLLGENEESRPAMQAINSLILNRMSQMLLAEGDCPEPRTFIFIDEAQSLKVDSLQEIATKGRSKGICLLLAFQSILGMHEMYGKEVAETILAQCRFKGFLKLSDHESAAWASKSIGDIELKRQQRTSTFESILMDLTGVSSRAGATEVIQQRNLVIPAEFINIPPINPITNYGLTGYYQVVDCHRNYDSWNSLSARLSPPAEYVEDYLPAPDSHQRLKPWTEMDWERLGITEVMRQFHRQPEQQFTHTNTDFGGWE